MRAFLVRMERLVLTRLIATDVNALTDMWGSTAKSVHAFTRYIQPEICKPETYESNVRKICLVEGIEIQNNILFKNKNCKLIFITTDRKRALLLRFCVKIYLSIYTYICLLSPLALSALELSCLFKKSWRWDENVISVTIGSSSFDVELSVEFPSCI